MVTDIFAGTSSVFHKIARLYGLNNDNDYNFDEVR